MSARNSVDMDRRETDGQAGNRRVSALATLVLEGEGESQRRRMLNEAADPEGEDSGPLSKLHVPAASGTTSLAAVSKTTVPVWTTVT